MTLTLPRTGFGYYVANDDTPGVTFGTTITSSGSTHTKGSWVALLTTITYDLWWHVLSFGVSNTTGTNRLMLLDLGIGPDSSNVTVVAENLICSKAGTTTTGYRSVAFPLLIPAGTQLWTRCQSVTATQTVNVAIQSWGGPSSIPSLVPAVSQIKAYGADTATSTGTTYTPGTSADGAYTELTASTSNDCVGFFLMTDCSNTALTALGGTASLGLGAATEFNAGMSQYMVSYTSEIIYSRSCVLWVPAPAGSRLTVHGACHGTPNTTMKAVAYGLVAA